MRGKFNRRILFSVLAFMVLFGGVAGVMSTMSTPKSYAISNTVQGVWINKGSNCAWQANTSCTLSIQVTSDLPLSSINFLAEWNQTWYTLCKDTPNNGTSNQYDCTITDWHTTDNFNYPPIGPIRFRVDAYDTSGNVTYYVGGDFFITFGQSIPAQTPTPAPTQQPTAQPTPKPPSPSPNGGAIQLCSGSNYSGDCESFTYPGSNDQCQSLGRMAGSSDSLRFLGNYSGSYHLILYHDTNCTVSLSEFDHDSSDFGLSKNQYSGIKINYTGSTQQSTPNPSRSDYVTACTGTNYSNTCERFRVGKYTSISTRYQSFWVPCDLTLFVNDGNNFNGTPNFFNNNVPDLNVSWTNMIVRSINVEPRTDCTPTGPIDPPTQPDPTPTPNPAQPIGSGNGIHIPGGEWVTYMNTFVKRNSYTIVVRGYPTKPSDQAIAYVNVTGEWNGTWHMLCHIPNNRPDLGDYYYCTTNLNVDGSYPPDGQITLSFDVYNINGDVNYAPNGEYTGTFSSTETTLSQAERMLDQQTKMVLTAQGHQMQDAYGELAKASWIAVQCGFELFGGGLLKIPGKVQHAAKVITKIYHVYENGMTGASVALDLVNNQYVEVVWEVAHAFNPVDNCTTIVQYDLIILYVSVDGLLNPPTR